MQLMVNAVSGKVAAIIVRQIIYGDQIEEDLEQLMQPKELLMVKTIKRLAVNAFDTQLNDEKATKNDDLEADVEQWNVHIISHYREPEEQQKDFKSAILQQGICSYHVSIGLAVDAVLDGRMKGGIKRLNVAICVNDEWFY